MGEGRKEEGEREGRGELEGRGRTRGNGVPICSINIKWKLRGEGRRSEATTDCLS